MRKLLAFCVGLCTIGYAAAATINLDVRLTSIDPSLAPFFALGTRGSVSFSFVSVADVNPDPRVGQYAGAVANLSISIGPYQWSDASGNLMVRNDLPDQVSMGFVIGLNGPTLPGFKFSDISLIFEDSRNSALVSDGIPSTLDMNKFDTRQLNIGFLDQSHFDHSIHAFDVLNHIPEPGAALFLVAGLLGLVSVARRLTR